MATQTGPKIPVFTGAADGDTYTPPANRMLRMQQALIQCNAIDFLDDPPVSPANGDTYIVGVGTGAWAGHDNGIAYWTTQDLSNPAGVWEFYTPVDGWKAYVVSNTGFFSFSTTFGWIPFPNSYPSGTSFNGTGTAIINNITPGYTDAASYVVLVSYEHPTVNPGILSVEYVSGTQFKIHSDSATDASPVRWTTLPQ